jgi:hypothetical protein
MLARFRKNESQKQARHLLTETLGLSELSQPVRYRLLRYAATLGFDTGAPRGAGETPRNWATYSGVRLLDEAAQVVLEHLRREGTYADTPPRSAAVFDPVEEALAQALTKASGARRFDVVAQLAKELEARRLARASNVVPLDPKARRRRG